MNHLLNMKTVVLVQPQVIRDNADWAGSYGDSNPNTLTTDGYDYVRFVVAIGATDKALAEMALYSSDTAIASGADDTDYTLHTGTDWVTLTTQPSATDDNKLFATYVDLRKAARRKYWCIQLKAGNGTAGTYAAVWADLSMPNGKTPSTAALRGMEDEIFA